MPRYDFKCGNCEDVEERIKSFYDDSPELCNKCNGEMTRQFSMPAIQFKGAGFYSTDNRKK